MTMQAAVWYMSYHQPGYTICSDEEAAARMAWGINDSGNASVTGVQFSDGRLISIDDWAAYKEIEEKYDRQAREQIKSRKPSAQRRIKDPFRNFELSVDLSEPEWIGEKS